MTGRKGLANLIGETITDVEVVDYDHLGKGERVDELYRVTVNGGRQYHFLVNGEDTPSYGRIDPVNLDSEGKIEGKYNSSSAKYIGQFKSLKNNKE